MSKKTLISFLIFFIGADLFGQGTHYFIAGKHHENTDLRNYAVIGQIIFALAVIAYGVWYIKKPAKKLE